jgi:hypothetical protein
MTWEMLMMMQEKGLVYFDTLAIAKKLDDLENE